MRTAFEVERIGDPTQIVKRQVKVPWQAYDWRGLPQEWRAGQFESLLREGRHSRFEVHKAPLLRLTLIQMDEAEYRLVWTFHHALLDGRSFPLVLNEVFAFYESFRRGQILELPLPRPYGDFIE